MTLTALILLSALAFATSVLTFFSGFGLGTVLMPFFALYFPLDLAIAMTAVVHFGNNLFKFYLLRRDLNWPVIWKFGIPALAGAGLGSLYLSWWMSHPLVLHFECFGRKFSSPLIQVIMAFLILIFLAIEIIPRFKNYAFAPRYLSFGGLLSGFFGGLSGHQGALRSLFLIRLSLSKEAFISTGVVIALAVDGVRLFFYGWKFQESSSLGPSALPGLGVIVLSSMAGALLAQKVLKQVTYKGIQKVLSIMLIFFALALGLGLI